MASTQRIRRAVVVGAFLVAAAATPAIAVSSTGVAQAQPGQGRCLAWFGARDTGKCIAWSSSSAPAWSVGTQGVYINPAQPGQSLGP